MPRGRKNNQKKTTNGFADLRRELFQAAINLRGAIEPADYKRYVLPIIFLRFLSLKYEKRYDELQRLVEDPSSEFHDNEWMLKDPSEYRSVGAFIVPENARWSYLNEHAQDDDIKIKVDDALKAVEETYPEALKGLLPRIFATSNLDAENVRGLITLFSKDIFKLDNQGLDRIGAVYEYFIGEFADSEGKRGGEYFTPLSIVKTLVAMLAPKGNAKVFDPCCGSGGMFVQAEAFTRNEQSLSFFGQESKEFTYRLCKMNLFIHGIGGEVQLGNSYFNDQFANLKADYVIANPPFNDGSKGEDGWGANRIPAKDPRLKIGGETMLLAPRNANTMWMLNFLYHLAEGGTAGFVMATGELANSETARLDVRKALVEGGYVDCIVQLTGQLFANTQIPCSLWFLSKNRDGKGSYRKRKDEILFVDGRKLGTLMEGSRKQKELSEEEIERMASVYREFKLKGIPEEQPGFVKVASLEEVRATNYALIPGRYVGAEEMEDDDEPFEEKMPRLVGLLRKQMEHAQELDQKIIANLDRLGFGKKK